MNVTPINRNQKFFSEEEYLYYLDMAREHMASLDTKVLFIKIDKEKSQIDDLYGEGYKTEITVKEAIEIPAIIKFGIPENKTYIEDKGILRYEEFGNLEVNVLLEDIKQMNAHITYGDYVGYQVDESTIVYFEVSNDAQKHYENSKSFFGYRPFWKTITCVPSQINLELL